MDIEVLKKKISTYKSSSGRVGKLSDDLLYEVLTAWENWSGSRLSFYSAIGVSQKGFASILGKAKKLSEKVISRQRSSKRFKLMVLPLCRGESEQ
jgi:hypothetical protein